MKNKKKYRDIYRYIFYLLALLAKGIVQYMPRGAVLRLGRGMGRLCFWLLPRERNRALKHLRLVYGERKDLTRIVQGVFENLGMNLLEWFQLPRLSKKREDKIFKYTGLEKIERALRNDKGIIMLTGHLGNWEYLAAAMALRGFRGAVVGRKIYYPPYNNLLCSLRAAAGVETIWRDDSARKMLRVLRQNMLLGILPDQDTKKVDGIFVDFFGYPSYTPTGPVNLALASGAAVLPCFIIREGNYHRIIIEDPLPLTVREDKMETLRINTQRWSNIIEEYIRRYPGQWVWIHRKWRTKADRELCSPSTTSADRFARYRPVPTKSESGKMKDVRVKFKSVSLLKAFMKRKRLAFGLWLAAAVFGLCSCISFPLLAEENALSTLSEEVKGFMMTMVDKKGKSTATVSGSMANLLSGGLIEIDDVLVRIYKPKPGEPDIIVHTAKGTYNRAANVVETDEFVRINHMDTVITGSGLCWEPDRSVLRIKRNVKVKYHTPREQTAEEKISGSGNSEDSVTVITAEGSGKMDYRKNNAVFRKNVVVTDPQVTLKAKRMKIFFDSDTKGRIAKIEAYGGVRIKQPERESSSRKAVYYTGEDKVLLVGNPRIVQGLDLYTADRITIYEKGSRVIFEPRAQLVIYPRADHDLL